ncbi:MAG TPA: hypothetical protein VHA55_06540 [Pseudorhodoplanes sp.]|nr:hypothetical protein [Pseudorhodoplanes sp.]
MLCGQAVVAIWNDITEEGRAEFYAWHVIEHMPERVGIPGFLRGRRYCAIDKASKPEFFTLYELLSFEVTTGQDYLSRLNAPTPWTRKATSAFRNTSRGLARVLKSVGPGPGGMLSTIRFGVDDAREAEARVALADLMNEIARLPQVTGAHLGLADAEASGIQTAESRHRTDGLPPPKWFVLIETLTAPALDEPIRRVTASPLVKGADVGRYRHEYTRLKTDWSPG